MCASKRGFIFNSVRLTNPKRNAFNLSYENKLSCDMGKLYPFMVLDVLPHDTVKVGQEYLMRCQPMFAPMMHRVDIYQHYFFVPLRLVWDNFEKFITGGADGTETAEHPYITSSELFNGVTQNYNITGTLLDYLGYPNNPEATIQGPPSNEKFSSLRIRAYNLIWNEFFRDQNLQQEIMCPKTDGRDTATNLSMDLQYRAWRKDYFTSALPFQQRGPQVLIPNQTAITLDNTKKQKVVPSGNQQFVTGADLNLGSASGSATSRNLNFTPIGSGYSGSYDPTFTANIDPNGSLVNNVNIPINELRRANALQRWFERNARAGSRYVEQILSHFGIRPSDYRLQRPMYLGGGKQPFTIQDVVQTSETDNSPQGTMAGKGTAANTQYVFKETFEEHGIIIGLVSILPRGAYMQGVNRMLTKLDKYDYAFPEFGNIGEQEVLEKELFYDPTNITNQNRVFGYQSRYAEYKYKHDEVHGDFRTSLLFWHMARKFASAPLLNGSFIQCSPDEDRVFAVNNVDRLLFDFYNNIEVLRCLPAYGTPAL